MFGGKAKRDVEPVQEVTLQNAKPVEKAPPQPVKSDEESRANYISPGTVIEGNIVSHEDLHLEGTVKGDIKTTAKLVLGKAAIVEGNILAAEAVVAGRITGTVESKGLLGIKSTCVIDGDIITKSLNVESGSTFNGRCKVGGTIDKPSNENKPAISNRLTPAVGPAIPSVSPANPVKTT